MAENNSILDKLEGLVSRYEEVGTLITDPNVISDQKRYVKLTKEYKDLGDIMKARKEYMDSLQTLQDAKDILTTEDDPEMKEMAREEMAAAEKHIPEMEERIKLLLVPADPEDDKNVIMEIRGGTGGDEAALFAGDLFRMYTKYCEMKGWKIAISSFTEGAAGGFKEIIFSVTGEKVYGTLKYESGVHRVQRGNGNTRPRTYLGRNGGRTARSPRIRRGNQRRRNQMGHFPLQRRRRTEREQGGIRRTCTLSVEKPQYGRDRGNPDRMY